MAISTLHILLLLLVLLSSTIAATYRGVPLHRFADTNITSFRARMERYTQRVAYISTIILGEEEVYNTKSTTFGTNIVPRFNGELFFVVAHIGTPPVPRLLLVDTGSDLTWYGCLQPASSSTLRAWSCASAQGQHLLERWNRGCNRNQCAYHIEYADGASSRGILISDSLQLGHTTILGSTMGCGRDYSDDFKLEFDGVLGLGRGAVSIVQQVDSDINGVFGYCLPNPWIVTSCWLGFGKGIIPNGQQPFWATLLDNPRFPSFYYVRLLAVFVGEERLQLPDGIFNIDRKSGRGGVMMDSGTVVTWFPRVVYEALRDSFVAQTRDVPRAPPYSNIFDTCYDWTSDIRHNYTLPLVSLQFDGAKVHLGLHATLIRMDSSYIYCLAFKSSPFGHTIIGNTQQAGVQISYDTVNKKVWFGPDMCQ